MKRYKNKLLIGISAAAAVLFGTAAMPLQCAADGSIEDVYDAMRRIGLPESMIQEARNQYQSTAHDDSGMEVNGNYFTYDVWANMVELYEDEIWDEVGKQFNVSGEDIKNASADTTTPSSQTASPSETTAAPVETEVPFVNMTLEEKQDYVASLPESDRASFLAGLSNSERNSIIKQMSTDSQANIANGFIELGEQLGMHVSVDSLDGSGISYSVRSEDGTLIDVSAVGTSVDDTGWNTTLPVLGSAAAVLGAGGGLILLAGRMCRKEEQA